MAISTKDNSFAEKEFYLDEFRGKSLLFALSAEELAEGLAKGLAEGLTRAEEEAADVFADLLINGTRVLLILSTSGDKREIQRIHRLQERLVDSTGRPSAPASPPIMVCGPSLLEEVDDHLLWQIWTNLRAHPLCICLVEAPFSSSSARTRSLPLRPFDQAQGRLGSGQSLLAADGRPADGRPTDGRPTDGRPTDGRPTDGRPTDGRPDASLSSVPLVTLAQYLAVRLQIYKFVLIGTGEGIVTEQGERFSFINDNILEELLQRKTGLDQGRTLLEAVRAALVGGVASVSLCPLPGLAKELFTYDGCGTLFTSTDYCRVERLGIDDFYEVEKLLERGEQEGYLKARTSEEMGRVLLGGYGAKIGPGVGHLAGVCSLQSYTEANAGEIVGLYTITRFKGEGIGSKLVTKMITEGERLGLAFLFACTTQEGAQRLFERQGFCRVSPEGVPMQKWQGYDSERKKQVATYKLTLPSR